MIDSKTSHPIDEKLEFLKSESASKTQKTLDKIHEVCRRQHEESKSKDFSISTIARLIPDKSPTEQAIRNNTASGNKYRALIAEWSKYANGGERNLKKINNKDSIEQSLSLISDAGQKALALSIYEQLKQEKKKRVELTRIVESEKVIDLVGRKSQPEQITFSPREVVDLTDVEREALEFFVSTKNLEEQQWRVTEVGAIETLAGSLVYEPGLYSAILKVLRIYE